MSTFDKVKEVIIDKLGVDESAITEEAHFVNDLGADSLDTVELIMEFEEEFSIEIPDEDAENITTVSSAIKYIDENKENFTAAIDEVFPGENKFDINVADANIRFHNNDWIENKNGESYLERLERATNREVASSLRVSDGPEFEAFLQSLFDSAKRTTGTDTGIPKTEVGLRGIVPPKSTVSPNNSPH